MKTPSLKYRKRQEGAAAVEFAIIAVIFFILLIAAMELGRVLFYMNSASEATRLGARIAVVCDIDAAGIERRMRRMLNLLEPDYINVTYNPGGCTSATCQSVTVTVTPFPVNTFIPFVSGGFGISMPSYTTTLPRESLSSTNNELCT